MSFLLPADRKRVRHPFSVMSKTACL